MSRYLQGSWNVICDRCGRKKKAGETRKEWTGLRVCRIACWEARHPQDFVRGVPDDMTVPWARPVPEPSYAIEFYLREDGEYIRRESGYPLARE